MAFGMNSYAEPFEDPEEEHRRKMELLQEQARQNRYGQSLASMDAARNQRLGVGQTIEQRLADPYSDMYGWQTQPTPVGPQAAVNIGMEDATGEMDFRSSLPMVRRLAPDAGQRIAMLRSATRTGSALTPQEIQQRETIEADQAIRVAQERDRLLAARQQQSQQASTLRTSANIQAGADSADRMAIARDLETSASLTAPPTTPEGSNAVAAPAENPTPVAEVASGPAGKVGDAEAARQQRAMEMLKQYRSRGQYKDKPDEWILGQILRKKLV